MAYVFTLYQIDFAQTQKPYRMGILLTPNNGDFGAISVTERSCPALSLNWRVTYGISVYTIPDKFCAENDISDRCSHYIRQLFVAA